MVEGELCAEGIRLIIDYVDVLRIPRAATLQAQLAPASCQQCAAKLKGAPTASSDSPLEVRMIVLRCGGKCESGRPAGAGIQQSHL